MYDYFDLDRVVRAMPKLLIIAWMIIGVGWTLNFLAWNAIPNPYSILDDKVAFYEALERNAFYNEMTGYVLYSLVLPLVGTIYVLIRSIRWGEIRRRMRIHASTGEEEEQKGENHPWVFVYSEGKKMCGERKV